MDLSALRDRINTIDDDILELLAQRRELVRNVIQLKERQNLVLRDAEREEQLLGRLIRKGRELGLDAHAVTKIFHEVIDDSVRSQQLYLQQTRNPEVRDLPLRVAYQGITGNFSHLAARDFFSERDRCIFTGYPTFADVVEAVEAGPEDCALLPFESTTAGGISEVYDELLRTKLSVIGEEVFAIRHCLLAIEKVPLSKIRRVLSHWQALAQCTRFLSRLENCQREPVADTATAARNVKEDQDLSQAAIAGEEAARQYGLVVLERNIADRPDNYTRFIILGRRPIDVDPRIPAKTSLIMATADQAGALLKALTVLERHGVNMTKLESRPKRSSRFEYLFFLDVEGNQATQRVQEALVELRASTSFLKILGSYPMADRERTEPGIQALLGTGEDRFSEPGEPERTPRSASPAPSTLTRHLAGQAPGQPASVVVIGGIPVGGDDLVIFAGPSHITSEEQIRQCARHVRECGGRVLIGGCFQPQGSPSGLPELARERLDWLVAAGRAYDLPVVTEVITPADVEIVSEQVDALLIGPHNMQNVNLLSEVGSVHCPIVLVRGLAATVDQFLTAADCVLGRGNQQVILCEQGVRTFGTTTRNTLDLGAIPVLKQRTSLPIVVDPSHAAGQRELVAPLALAARAIEPHGLMIEVDPVPDATPDGSPQALDTGAFRQLMAALFR